MLPKRRIWALALILAILALTGALLINSVKANPYARIPPLAHPQISILTLEDNMLHTSNDLTIAFNVSMNFEKGWSYISYVTYKASWQPNEITIYEWRSNGSLNDPKFLSEFSYKLNLTGIPEGKQTVMVNVGGHGGYNDERGGPWIFDDAHNSSSISFTVNSAHFVTNILSPQNKTYNTSEVPLLLEISEPFTQISYSLDEQDFVMVSGNTTLTGLPNGHHKVTVYAADESGNSRTAQTLYFSVDEQETFPIAPVIALSGASVVIIGVGLLVHFRKTSKKLSI